MEEVAKMQADERTNIVCDAKFLIGHGIFVRSQVHRYNHLHEMQIRKEVMGKKLQLPTSLISFILCQ